MINRLTLYRKVLRIAALEAYQELVVYPDMENMIIGEDGDYSSKEEWLEAKMEEWLEEAKESFTS